MVIGVHVAVFDGGSFEKFVKGRFKRLFRGKYFDDGAEQDTLMKKGLRRDDSSAGGSLAMPSRTP